MYNSIYLIFNVWLIWDKIQWISNQSTEIEGRSVRSVCQSDFGNNARCIDLALLLLCIVGKHSNGAGGRFRLCIAVVSIFGAISKANCHDYSAVKQEIRLQWIWNSRVHAKHTCNGTTCFIITNFPNNVIIGLLNCFFFLFRTDNEFRGLLLSTSEKLLVQKRSILLFAVK